MPTLNDDDAQLEGLAGWISEELGVLTPWHVTRFYPQHHLTHLPPTPGHNRPAATIGKKAGLKFVYSGNVPGHESENTRCYNCGKIVVQRFGYEDRGDRPGRLPVPVLRGGPKLQVGNPPLSPFLKGDNRRVC